MWKLLTGIIGDEIYSHLERSSLLQNEQKDGRRGSRGTKNQLLIDQIILKNCRKAKKNLAIILIDYMKASVQHGVPFMEDIEMPDGQ